MRTAFAAAHSVFTIVYNFKPSSYDLSFLSVLETKSRHILYLFTSHLKQWPMMQNMSGILLKIFQYKFI